LPLRNKQTGVIEKWFGTCTDIHESVESRFAQKRMVRGSWSLVLCGLLLIVTQRQQLLSVIALAQVTLFSVDRNRNLNLIEGSFIWDLDSDIGSVSGDESSNARPSKSEEVSCSENWVFLFLDCCFMS
jgi:hypothetical protein